MDAICRSSTMSSSAADSDCSAEDHHLQIPVKTSGLGQPVHEGEFICPPIEQVNREIESFERRRLEFNEKQLRHMSSEETEEGWDRKVRSIILSF